jgi:hypothetical protein
MAYIDRSGNIRSSSNPTSVVRLAYPSVPRASTYYGSDYKPFYPGWGSPYNNYTADTSYVDEAIKKSVLNPKYLSNTTNGFAMNSLADAIFNKEARRKKWAGTVLDIDTGSGWFLDLVGITDIIDSALVMWDTVVKPIHGSIELANSDKTDDFSFWDGLGQGLATAGMNTLINVGNTLDIVANPVKGALIEGFSPTGDGFIKGFQRGLYGDSEYGRKQYDYADYIDNKLLAFGLEIISDPVNWVTWGSKAAVSSGAKALAGLTDDAVETVIDVVGKGLLKKQQNV